MTQSNDSTEIDRRLYLWGEIKATRIKNIIIAIHRLLNVSNEPIEIYLNTCGGSFDDAIALLDEMDFCKKYYKVDISTVVQGQAYSCGAFILLWGTKGCRCAYKNSSIMLHDVQYSLEDGSYAEHERASSHFTTQIESIKKQAAKLCGKASGIKYKRFCEDLKNSIWFTAAEAKRYGLIDRVL